MRKLLLLSFALLCTTLALGQAQATGTTKAGKYQMNIPDAGTVEDSVCVWNGATKQIRFIPFSAFTPNKLFQNGQYIFDSYAYFVSAGGGDLFLNNGGAFVNSPSTNGYSAITGDGLEVSLNDHISKIRNVGVTKNGVNFQLPDAPVGENILVTTINGVAPGADGEVTLPVGTGTVTTVTSSNGSINVTSASSTPDLSVVQAPKLTTARNINGVAFDGTTPITVTAAAGTLTGGTLASGVTSSSLTSFGSSPALSGGPTCPTAAPGTNSTQIANTAFVTAAVSAYSPPNLTGDVTSSGAVTSYNNVVPANKGGAGTIAGILKANGSGTVSAAVSGTDYNVSQVADNLTSSAIIAPSKDAVNTALALKYDAAGGILTGTGGAGYIGLPAQSSAPGTPASGVNVYARSTGAFSWKGTNGFERSFLGTGLTANRSYTLPDADVVLAGRTNTETLTNKTLTDPIVGTQAANDNSTKAASTAYADAKVQNSLTTSTTVAPSADAVNTALAGKVTLTSDWQWYTPTVTGVSGGVTGCRYRVTGKTVDVIIYLSSISNATTYTCTLPIAVKNYGTSPDGLSMGASGFSYPTQFSNNSAASATAGRARIVSNSNVVQLFTNYASAVWTASGSKSAFAAFTYEID